MHGSRLITLRLWNLVRCGISKVLLISHFIMHCALQFVEESEVEDRCKNYKYTIDDIDAILQSNKEASLYREHALAYALTQQVCVM